MQWYLDSNVFAVLAAGLIVATILLLRSGLLADKTTSSVPVFRKKQ